MHMFMYRTVKVWCYYGKSIFISFNEGEHFLNWLRSNVVPFDSEFLGLFHVHTPPYTTSPIYPVSALPLPETL